MSNQEKIVVDKMKERGYQDVSRIQTNNEIVAINFIKRINEQISLHAKITLKSEKVDLSFVELKYFCQLCTTGFAFDHPDFEKYENILTIYAAKCLDIDVFQVLEASRFLNKIEETKPEEKPKKDIKTRKREFWDVIVDIGKKRNYPKDGCKAFYDYWVQMNVGGNKLAFEIMKAKKGVFDVGGRMATWFKNDKTWKEEKINFVDKKIQKQDKEKETKTLVKKEEIF